MFNDDDSTVLPKPYKILLSFLDRANHGEKVLDVVMIDMLTTLHRHCSKDERVAALVRFLLNFSYCQRQQDCLQP